MSESFIEKVASMLGTLVESITTSNMLSFYGLDSIVAVELRRYTQRQIQPMPAARCQMAKSMPQGKENVHDGIRDTDTSKSNRGNGFGRIFNSSLWAAFN